MLVNATEMLIKARDGHYGVPQFNINNLEWTKAVLTACEEMKSPVILGVSEGAGKYMTGFKTVAAMVDAMVDSMGITVPVALHLDHGGDFEICKACIDGGFTSVMIDGSKHEFEENIALTKQVVEYAHAHGVVVEAELGKLAGVEDNISVDARSATFTDPAEAAEFVERTGVDSLAIAIGTSHGAYKFKGEPYLDFERLQEIHRLIPDTPLVLHGASTVLPEFVARCNEYGGQIPGAQGVPEEMIRAATKYGICKVNIDTDLRLAMTAEIRRYLTEHPADFDPRKYLGPARDAIRRMVSHKITDVLGWKK